MARVAPNMASAPQDQAQGAGGGSQTHQPLPPGVYTVQAPGGQTQPVTHGMYPGAQPVGVGTYAPGVGLNPSAPQAHVIVQPPPPTSTVSFCFSTVKPLGLEDRD